MAQKNLELDFVKQYVGRKVEIMIRPDVPVISGNLTRCSENFVEIGDAVLAYPLIWGIRLADSGTKHETLRTESKPESKIEKSETPKQELKGDWHDRIFEGELAYFNFSFGYIISPELKKFDIPLTEEGKIFVHLNQITDENLKDKLLSDRDNPRPNIAVTFKIGNNDKGYAADDVKAKNKIQSPVKPDTNLLSMNLASALSELGEIEYFRRYEEVPHGKIRTKDNKLYTFYEEDVIDPELSVFLECSPSAEGQPVKFRKIEKNRKIFIRNLESAAPFPEDRIKDWERSGLLQKAKERIMKARTENQDHENEKE